MSCWPQVLAGKPDLSLLDEPNNHLDIVSLRWLEKFLVEFKGCAIVVSHDHRFLDNICPHIIDVDYQRVTVYKGNDQAFLDGKAEHRDRLEREIDKREKEIADHKAFIQRLDRHAHKSHPIQPDALCAGCKRNLHGLRQHIHWNRLVQAKCVWVVMLKRIHHQHDPEHAVAVH